MRVFTPVEIAKHAANKYLGVLVAAKYSRLLNEFPRDRSAKYSRLLNEFPRDRSAMGEKKLTTRSLEELSKGAIPYRVVPRRRGGAE
jgi:DNA-directed RNA polymerase subunit K/omega